MRILLYGAAAVCVIAAAAFFALRTQPVKDAMKRFVTRAIEENTGMRLEFVELGGNPLFGLKIRGITLTEPGAVSPLFSADRVEVSYSVSLLLFRMVWIRHLQIDGAALDLERLPDRAWPVKTALQESPAEKSDGFRIAIRDLEIRNAKAAVLLPGGDYKNPLHVTGLELRATLNIGSTLSSKIRHLAFSLDHPELALTEASGYFRFQPDTRCLDFEGIKIKTKESSLTIDGRSELLAQAPHIDIHAGIEALSLFEIGRILSIRMPKEGVLTGSLQARGTPEKIEHLLELNLGRAGVRSEGSISLDRSEGLACDIRGILTGLNPAELPVNLSLPAGEINGEVSFKGQRLNRTDRKGQVSVQMPAFCLEGYAIDRASLKADVQGADLLLERLQVQTPFGNVDANGGITGVFSDKTDPRLELAGRVSAFNPAVFTSQPALAGSIDADVKARIQIPRAAGFQSCIAEMQLCFLPSRVMEIALSSGVLDLSLAGRKMEASLTVEQVTFQQASVEALTATMDWTGDMGAFSAMGRCNLMGLRMNNREIPGLDMKTTLTPECARLELDLTASRDAGLTLFADIGNWMDPVKEIVVERIVLASGGRSVLTNTKPARLTLFEDHVDIKTLDMTMGEGSLEVAGKAGFSPPYDLCASLVLSDLELNQIPAIWKQLEPWGVPPLSGLRPEKYGLRGVLNGRIEVSGDFRQPSFAGGLRLEDGFLSLKRQKLTYETLSADLRLEPGIAYISDLKLAGDTEGRLQVSGSVTYDNTGPRALNIRAVGEDLSAPVYPGVDARIAANLTLSGDGKAPMLSGDITVREGRVDLDRYWETQPSEIEVVRPASDESKVIRISDEASDSSSWMDSLAADVRVVILKDFWLKDPDQSVEISGDIDLKKQPGGSFLLYGPLSCVRGSYRFRGKIFDITRGELNFIGQEEINPPVSIDAETRIKDVKLIVHLTGTFERLNIALDSEPAMDEAEIISYLMFGRPQETLSEEESFSAQEAALSLTGEVAVDELRKVFGDRFGVDYLNITTGGGDLRQGSLDLGKYVTPKVFVIYRQGFTKDSPRQIQVDYDISRSFRLRTEIDEEKTSAVDLIWKHEF